MKSYIIALLVALAATICSTEHTTAAPKRLKGSGSLITKSMPAPTHFRGAHAARGVKLHLVADNGQPILIEADDNVMEYVVVTVEGGILRVTIDDAVRSISSHHATVTVPTKGNLRSLRAVSAGEIRSEVQITAEELGLQASSAGKINASVATEECEIDLSSAAVIECEVTATSCSIEASSAASCTATVAARECEVEASSAAKVTLKGAALECDAEVSSAANLNAKHFAVQRYEVEVSSGANADVHCLERLEASASSGGDIRYSGNCIVHSKRSSGGSVKSR